MRILASQIRDGLQLTFADGASVTVLRLTSTDVANLQKATLAFFPTSPANAASEPTLAEQLHEWSWLA